MTTAKPSSIHTAIEFATVDRWWQLAKDRPAYRQFTQTPLKDFGYLRLLQDLQQMGAARILEFGCGLWMAPDKNLFDLLPDCELWGIDDWQNQHYFPPEAEWAKQYRDLCLRFPNARFMRGLIGQPPLLETLPKGYFDAIVSVSVLEEIPDFYQSVFSHAFELLRPGGWLLGTEDFCATPLPAYPWQNFLHKNVDAQRAAGFALSNECSVPECIDQLLLENPVGVMLYYQGGEGEDRKFWGHFGTMYTAARKPDDVQVVRRE
jgi:SAM-dependent methyltransferase